MPNNTLAKYALHVLYSNLLRAIHAKNSMARYHS